MTIKIYKPSKSSMQSGLGKTKQWIAEYISEKEKTKLNSNLLYCSTVNQVIDKTDINR